MSDSPLNVTLSTTVTSSSTAAPRARRRATAVIAQYIHELSDAQAALASSVGVRAPCPQ